MSPHAEQKVPSGTNNWWKEATVYQVYPASFADSNGDGWGDIPGVISKIPYIHSLGVDCVWLSPMYDSPMLDMGYDVSDYERVLPAYGTTKDVENLVEACHERGMRLVLDLVINHTSDQHEWFKQSRSSKDNEKRDWYFWRKPRYDQEGNRLPPTNYRGYFAGTTWTFDEKTQEYYLHLYAKGQPDLNWDNAQARQAIYDSAIRFWLDRGVDGFRVDTVNKYSKVTSFPDAPITDPKCYIQPAVQMWCNGPRIHEFIHEMYDVMSAYGDIMTVGELSATPDPKKALEYVSAHAQELSMVLHLDVGHMGKGKNLEDKYDFYSWNLSEWKSVINKWQIFLNDTDAWTSAFIENHDNGRAVSRYGSEDPRFRTLSAKMLAIMHLSMTGTLYLYQGQEIGMLNAPSSWPIAEYKDVEGLGYYAEAEQQTASGKDPTRRDRIMRGIRILGRDHARLPMSWDDSAHGGFTSADATPWMRAHDLYPEINVENQEDIKGSVLEFYKAMIRIRKEYRDLFIHGSFQVLELDNETSFCFTKSRDDLQGQGVPTKALVALSFEETEQEFTQAEKAQGMKLLVCNYEGEDVPEGTLRPFEARIYVA